MVNADIMHRYDVTIPCVFIVILALTVPSSIADLLYKLPENMFSNPVDIYLMQDVYLADVKKTVE